ncbi:lycopene cyclase [Elizabethkingia ursingii]|uniref:Lycopene cyclase n=1 Tax=Elizabethkingia ursingii TaxID=1756150 RepID=A0ABX3N8K1_9FLAO|nr:lycopene cyclase domain-containing protein [Elizabethkingia ursingii]MCL1665739.1 lycopene cyclase domain-containing protein [Elizabethkingia ursingii]OPB88842.1 lycopene cyclase [Elizabethkingia ursingii]OPC04800.1 lycopene cyclase [Elizabethkingia ursingii]
MQAYTYLLINFFTIIICFIASFDRRIRFNRFFGIFLLSSTIVAIPFILWDVWFTKMGVWWFDTKYTLGIIIAGLPLEEWLFFFCIPFSCVFTYFCLDKFFNFSWVGALNNVIVFLSFILLTVSALLYYERTYTLVTALITLLTVFYLHFIAKSEWIGQATFTYLILMPGFFAVNGILTGSVIESPVVNYNPNEFLGIRIFTIPVEDAVYGYSQFLLNIYFFKLFRNRLILRGYS